jgi:hypothetical protein
MTWLSRILGVLLALFGILFFRNRKGTGSPVAQEIRSAADKKIDAIVSRVFADQLKLPKLEIDRAIGAPSSSPEVFHKLKGAVRDVTIMFDASKIGTSSDISIRVSFSNGVKTTVTETWHWTDLPDEVRERLLRTGHSVEVPWSFHE